ncbi:Ig-like domain-containing protein [Candidatus Uhrbacteria bacterium]|nr:Ig-like domain-containing protein [Candidatus Uhrbacteria bacterium]
MTEKSTQRLASGFVHAVVFAVVAFSVLALWAVALPALAQTSALETVGSVSGLPTDNIAIIIARIIRQFLMVIGILFTVLIVYAGFLYLTARGEPDPVKKAKKIFQQSIIGLVIIFSAYGIATFILDRLLDAAFSGSTSATADAYSEPLSGSLGGGILDDHYPERNATDIPRNTRIFVSFKEAMNPASLIEGYVDDTTSTDLDIQSVLIYPTAEGSGSALAQDEVVVTYDDAFEIFVFDPVEYLGSAEEDTNYTVVLTTDIEKADGSAAFSGSYADGYAWTFEVSTEIDLTPPTVTSVVPIQDADEPRNVTIEVNFSEAMDPVAGTGAYDAVLGELFTNLSAFDEAGANIEGTWEIGNAYRTIDFTTTDACSEDPCGDTIYCLPGNETISVTAKAATLNEDEVPQGEPTGVTFDGLVDAASNSLDGDGDGDACGSSSDTVDCADGDEDDDYDWSFTTTDEIEDTVPQVESVNPGLGEDEISQTNDLTVTFNTYLKSSTVDSSSVSLWPDPWYEMWFAVRKSSTGGATQVAIEHPTFVSTADGGWDYWPVLTQDVKSTYQICMYPAIGPDSCTESRSSLYPYCCEGTPSASACTTDSGEALPDNSD